MLYRAPGNQKGDQKPDSYKFDESKKTLFIIEAKNYKVENGIYNLVNNIFDQASRRIDNCMDVSVPQGLMGNTENGYIENMTITFAIDLDGHELHKNNSPVLIKELDDIPKKVYSKLRDQYGNLTAKRVYLRIGTIINGRFNKPLDVSYYDLFSD